MKKMDYDNQNIFAKILRSEIPCHKVYEDDKTLAFMDIMPINPEKKDLFSLTPGDVQIVDYVFHEKIDYEVSK